ncbi:pyridoxine [Sclerotinia borealis F-4128]|uniref:glutaminase n=1 Tax=Sclerotinia borealis (strain F-4128) TaxID=1432307 RepID=W9CPS1_SCLBF|nr:pyridoxine [Sclerotinia borealis F-4128]
MLDMENSPLFPITIGVLALQGAFNEHIQLLRSASQILATKTQVASHQAHDLDIKYNFIEVRNEIELDSCDALIIPGGESTAISLVAQRSGLLEPLRDFVKLHRHPTWGTCAGLILLSESANRTKAGGQELIGGLDVRVNRNHFGRQVESFQADLDLPFLSSLSLPPSSSSPYSPNPLSTSPQKQEETPAPFRAIFIRAPIVEKLLPHLPGPQISESHLDSTVIAPSRPVAYAPESPLNAPVEILATLPGRTASIQDSSTKEKLDAEAGDIVAVRQANVFGTSFHPELTGDARIHAWWLEQVIEHVVKRRQGGS